MIKQISHYYVTFLLMMLLLIWGCAGMAPTTMGVRATLTPAPLEGESDYAIDEQGFAVFDLKGLKIAIKPMTDKQLNDAFPDISEKGKASTNPYTYGNWRDPELGYTPNRFTVFVLQVVNRTFPKVNLDPRKAILTSDRGDELAPYGRDAKDETELNFEDYYLRIRGATGVEKDRFEERMGTVRQTLFVDGQIFKGDKKEGMLVFDPLHKSVQSVELTIKDLVLEYDANNWPSKTQDFKIRFNREVMNGDKK